MPLKQKYFCRRHLRLRQYQPSQVVLVVRTVNSPEKVRLWSDKDFQNRAFESLAQLRDDYRRRVSIIPKPD